MAELSALSKKILFYKGVFMQSVQGEMIVKKEKQVFYCIFLDDNGYCISKKTECPKTRTEKKCQEAEDAFQ